MLNPVNDDRDYAPFVEQFEQQGFARVPLTDAMARKIERIYRLGEEFFVRSEAEKQSYSMQSSRGYRELAGILPGAGAAQFDRILLRLEPQPRPAGGRGAVGGLELHRALR